MKITTIRRACILFWHGLVSIVAGIAGWITEVLGMKDDSMYCKLLRRIVGTCFAIFAIMVTVAGVFGFCEGVYGKLDGDQYFEESYDSRYLSRGATYYSRGFDNKSYVKNREGQTTIDGILWIAKPLGEDSLVCYSDGKRRGYFNIYNGEPVIKAQYKHAWVFSNGLAAVDVDGWIKFIDQTGKVVIDIDIPFMSGAGDYVFHNGYCVVQNDNRGLVGLIDRQGKWVLEPEYVSIVLEDSLWIVDNGKERSVLSADMKTIIPFMDAKMWIVEDAVCVTMSDHTLRRYNRKGELTDDFFINSISPLLYETSELRYATTKYYNEEGCLESVTEDKEPSFVKKKAKCQMYEAETGWYGLMSPEGRVITKPIYNEIMAMGYDMYLCKDNSEDGVMLNGKGEKIK